MSESHSARHLRLVRVLRFACLVATVAVAAAFSCNDSPTSPSGFTAMITKPVSDVTSGGNGFFTVNIERKASFTGAVQVTASSSVSGVTIATITVPSGATSASMTIAVTSATVPGKADLQIRAVADGVAPSTDGTTFIVVAPVPAYAFNVLTTPLNVAAGGSATDIVNVIRTNFTGAIDVTGSSDAGITVSAAPPSVTGNQTTLTVAVTGGVSAGTHTVVVKGVSTLPQTVTASFAIIVSAQPTMSWTFCPASGVPIWFAVQDGIGSWTRPTAVNSVYTFPIASTKGGVAYVTYTDHYELHVLYGSQSELQTQGASMCPNTGAIKTVSGSVINTGTAARALVSLGSAYRSLTFPASTFQMLDVAPGAIDVIGATVDGASPPNIIRMVSRRSVTPANASTLPPLDFSAASTESFLPQSAALILVNSLGQQVNLDEYLHTSNSALIHYYEDGNSSPATTRTLFGLPAANQSAGDLHYLSALANGNGTGAVPYRTQGLVFGAVAAKTVAFGSALSTPTVSKATAVPAVVVRAAVPVQAEYGKLWQADYDQISSKGQFASVQVTAAYAGTASPVLVDVPDLSAVAGWQTFYGLAVGTPAFWRVTASSWSTPGGITFAQFIDGATFTSATAQGTITP
jgi:hypothetical protein